jgi:hypothetical protein
MCPPRRQADTSRASPARVGDVREDLVAGDEVEALVLERQLEDVALHGMDVRIGTELLAHRVHGGRDVEGDDGPAGELVVPERIAAEPGARVEDAALGGEEAPQLVLALPSVAAQVPLALEALGWRSLGPVVALARPFCGEALLGLQLCALEGLLHEARDPTYDGVDGVAGGAAQFALVTVAPRGLERSLAASRTEQHFEEASFMRASQCPFPIATRGAQEARRIAHDHAVGGHVPKDHTSRSHEHELS